MRSPTSSSAFSLAFRDRKIGILVGSDYRKPDIKGANVATTSDGGKSWAAVEKPPSFRSGVAWAKDRWLAVGTSGADSSADDGKTWESLDREKYNAVSFTPAGDGWAVGPKGRIAKYVRPNK